MLKSRARTAVPYATCPTILQCERPTALAVNTVHQVVPMLGPGFMNKFPHNRLVQFKMVCIRLNSPELHHRLHATHLQTWKELVRRFSEADQK